MKAQLILLVAGITGGLATGWLIAPQSESASAAAETALPQIVHAGAEASSARERLARLGLVAPREAVTEPPPPDIAVLFRRDLMAIEDRGGRRIAWIVDFTQTYQRRGLRVGDVYQDGWRVSRIGAQSIDLRRRREVRTVSAFAPVAIGQ